jgi:hypothetical protein
MFKILLAFVVIFVLFFLGIKVIRNMTGQSVIALTKIVAYSIMCSLLTIAVLVGIVILF